MTYEKQGSNFDAGAVKHELQGRAKMLYRVTAKTTGIEWAANGKTRRVESGQTASDFLPESIPDLLAQGYIEEVKGGTIPEDDIPTATLDMETLI